MLSINRASPAVERVPQRLLQPLAPSDRGVAVRLMSQIAAAHNDKTSAPLRLD